MPAVPLRVPPPPATSVQEQWIIDGLLHLDECVDEGKKEQAKGFDRLNHAFEELRAEVFAWLTAGKDADSDLQAQIVKHQAVHDAMDAANKAKRGQISQAWSITRDGIRAGYDVAKVAIALGALKVLGVL